MATALRDWIASFMEDPAERDAKFREHISSTHAAIKPTHDAVTGDDGRQRYLYPAVAMFREAPQAPPTIAERVAEREAAKAAGK